MSTHPYRLDAGAKLFLVILGVLLVPTQYVVWVLYGFGALNIVSFLVLLLLNSKHNNSSDAPGWAKETMAPVSTFLKFNLHLVTAGLIVLWQFHPLWGGA